MKIYKDLYWSIISPKTLFHAWEIFKSDKRNKPDVAEFELNLEQNIFGLYRDLKSETYKHGPYKKFWVHDPKRRPIHKAAVRDRVLHHAMFQVLNPIFEPTFIPTSFSCRIGKGTHRGVEYLTKVIRKVSKNYTKPCFVLKCDIRKFFNSIDHNILLRILKKKINDAETMRLLEEIVGSYSIVFTRERERERESKEDTAKKGIPIGNLTSQIFANIYMNEFDQFVKHTLKIKHYARYTDDFIMIADNKEILEHLVPRIRIFLFDRLKLSLHPNKVSIRRYIQGIDFLGQVIFPHHRLLRAQTKKRIFRKLKGRVRQYKSGLISEDTIYQSLQSYLGVLSHTNGYKAGEELKNQFWFWMAE